ncbi:MAG: DUF2029 domain-containing protein, partial [Chloroflexota bacterium]|nr:DUF2029 domain-containing protein [Chloroflexota bacterium]
MNTRAAILSSRRWWPYLLLGLAAIYFVISLWESFATSFALDFAVNWTAARGLHSGISLYDRPALHELGLRLIDDPAMSGRFLERFNSVDNSPGTAVLTWPFALLPFEAALALFRATLLAVFGLAVLLAGLALPPPYRGWGWFAGLMGLFLLRPVVASIWLGQLDAFVLLGLSAGTWAASRSKWWLAGVGIGAAAVLKVVPGLVLLYLVLKGKWQALAGALLLAVGALLASLL